MWRVLNIHWDWSLNHHSMDLHLGYWWSCSSFGSFLCMSMTSHLLSYIQTIRQGLGNQEKIIVPGVNSCFLLTILKHFILFQNAMAFSFALGKALHSKDRKSKMHAPRKVPLPSMHRCFPRFTQGRHTQHGTNSLKKYFYALPVLHLHFSLTWVTLIVF